MYRSNITVSRQKKIYVKNRFIGNPFFDDVVDQALLKATLAEACRATARRHVYAI